MRAGAATARRTVPWPRAWPFVAFVALVATLAGGCATSYTVTLTRAEIQNAVDRRLPVSTSKLFVTATVRAVGVELAENGNCIFLRPEVEVSLAGQRALAGRATVEGQIRYASETGALFLANPVVEEVAIEGLPSAARPVAEDLVGGLLEGYLATMPLYRLNQTDFKQSLARLVLRSVRVHNGRLEIVLGVP